MLYSKVEDLLLGDLIIPRTVSKDKFIEDASDEMDAKLGWMYATPLAPCEVPADATETEPTFEHLPRHERLLLKSICNRLASGRLILTLDAAGEQTTLHAYGYRLVQDALGELNMLANGEVELSACPPLAGTVAGGDDRVPEVYNEDEESLLLGFQNTVLRGQSWWTKPGSLP